MSNITNNRYATNDTDNREINVNLYEVLNTISPISTTNTILNLLNTIKNNTNSAIGNGGDNSSIGEDSIYGNLTIGTVAIEIKVGATKLGNRKMVLIDNNTTTDCFYGLDNTVTTTKGFLIPAKTERVIYLKPIESLSLFAISTTNTIVTVGEVV